MQLATVKEFRDRATQFLRSRDPVLITRRGKPAGVFISLESEDGLPLELRREILAAITARVRQSLAKRGLSEQAVLDDFEAFRAARR
jgi:prevent-host-death family protein